MMTFPVIPAGYPALFERFQTLHLEMMEEIGKVKQEAVSILDTWQAVFDSSVNYRLQLRELTSHPAAFEKVEEEIFYFKRIKPLFLAQTLLATYIYYVEMYKADKPCPTEFAIFLERELLRLPRFESRYGDFLAAVSEGQRQLDLDWFTRDGWDTPGEGLMSDETRGERILAAWYANRCFRDYLLREMGEGKAAVG